jgi:DHA1 family tetracycline resistance protein-like MFS transporter
MPPASRYRAAIGFIFVTCVLDVVALGVVIPVLPPLIEEFAGSTARAGVINGVFVALWAGMQFVASPVIGSLSDRYGRRPVILLSGAGLTLDYALMALAPNLWWLAVGRMIAGITSSSFTAAFAYMADITPPEERARAYGLIGAAFSGGFVAGPLLGGVLGEVSPRFPFWVAAALGAATFLYGLFILPESLAPENRMAFSWKRANPFGAMKLLARSRELIGLSVVNFFLYFAHHLFSAVFVLYAGHRFGWMAWEVGLCLALVGALDMIVQGVLTGPVVKRLGDGPTMIAGLFGGAVGVACMGLAPTGAWFYAAMLPNALWGLAMPTLQSLMTRKVSESEQGQLQGANMSVSSIAGVLSPLFFGAVYSASVGEAPVFPHVGTAFFIAAGFLLVAAVLGMAVGRRTSPLPMGKEV